MSSSGHRMSGVDFSREEFFFFVTVGPVKAAYVPLLWRIKPFVVLCFSSKSGWESTFTRFFFSF